MIANVSRAAGAPATPRPAARAFVPFALAHVVILAAAAWGWLHAAGLNGAAFAFSASAFALRLGLCTAALVLLSRAPRAERLTRLFPPFAFTGILIYLFLDRRLWDAQRVHLGREHLAEVLRPDAIGWMELQPDQVAWFVVACLVLLAIEWGAWWALLRMERNRTGAVHAWRLLLALCALAVVPGVLWRPFAGDVLLRAAHVVPFPPSPAAPERGFVLEPKGRDAAVPEPSFAAPVTKDVVLLVIDSWRSDALSSEVTPALWKLARRSAVFQQHWSASNATDWGFFSLLYGLLPPYYVSGAREGGPPLFRRARQIGYRVGFFWGTSNNFSAETELAALDPTDVHLQQQTGDVAAQDRQTVDRFGDFVRSVPDGRPLMAVLFLSSPHSPYWFDRAGAPFEPWQENMRFASLKFDDPDTIQRVRNRYRNSVRFADGQAGRMLAVLEEAGRLDEAVLVFTGDHGEMFKEHGAWGHGRGFSPEELRVPLLVHGLPGLAPGARRAADIPSGRRAHASARARRSGRADRVQQRARPPRSGAAPRAHRVQAHDLRRDPSRRDRRGCRALRRYGRHARAGWHCTERSPLAGGPRFTRSLATGAGTLPRAAAWKPVIPSSAMPAARHALTTRNLDFWLLGGASLVLWWVLLMGQHFRGTPGGSTVDLHYANLAATSSSLSLLVNNPHFMASYLLAYRRGVGFVKAHGVQLALVPLILLCWITAAWWTWDGPVASAWNAPFLALGLGAPAGPTPTTGQALMGLLLHLMFLTVGWHYSKQAYGCMMVYARYDGHPLDDRQRTALRWSLHSIWACSFVGLNLSNSSHDVMRVPYYGLDFPRLLYVGSLFGVGAGVGLLLWVLRSGLRSGHRPSACFLVPWLSFAVWFLPPLRQTEFVLLFVPFFHGLQYLAFVYRVESGRAAARPPRIGFLVSTVVILGLVVAGYLAFDWIPNKLNLVLDVVPRTRTYFFVTAALAFVNVHHYFIDNVIWRLRDPELRRELIEEPS